MGLFDLPGLDSILGGLTGSKNADAAMYAADAQWSIADKIQRREEQRHQIWRDHYRAGELRLAREICLRPKEVPVPEHSAQEIRQQVNRAFSRVAYRIERGIDNQCSQITCGTDAMLTLSMAGIHVWAAGMTFRADEDRARARNQQRYEDLSRVAAFGHRSYFNTRGAELAMGVYAQSYEMAMKQQSNTSAALGAFLQKGLSYAQQSGWFNNQPVYGTTPTGNTSSLSGQGEGTATDTSFVALPLADGGGYTSSTQVEAAPVSEMGNTGYGANYPG